MTGGPLLPLGPLVECAQRCERHRGDAGLDGWLRHRREQLGMVAGKRRSTLVGRRPLLRLVYADIEHHQRHVGYGKFGNLTRYRATSMRRLRRAQFLEGLFLDLTPDVCLSLAAARRSTAALGSLVCRDTRRLVLASRLPSRAAPALIPIARAAKPVPNLPRLRALALFGRRPVGRAELSYRRRSKTTTEAAVRDVRRRILSIEGH